MKLVPFYTLIVIAFALLMTSCEGGTDRYWDVQNNSSSAIEVIAITSFESTTTSESINSGQRASITITYQLGGSAYPHSPGETFNSMLITNETGDTSKKDFSIAENWATSITQLKRTPSLYEHQYVLHISDSDF